MAGNCDSEACEKAALKVIRGSIFLPIGVIIYQDGFPHEATSVFSEFNDVSGHPRGGSGI